MRKERQTNNGFHQVPKKILDFSESYNGKNADQSPCVVSDMSRGRPIYKARWKLYNKFWLAILTFEVIGKQGRIVRERKGKIISLSSQVIVLWGSFAAFCVHWQLPNLRF